MPRAGIWGAFLAGAVLVIGLTTATATLPSSSVALAWDRSPDSSVTSYRVYFGVASGKYTNSFVVGNVTSNTVSGLSGGLTYFFAVCACDALGLESKFSNEVAYTVPRSLPSVQVGLNPAKQAVLSLAGSSGAVYDILASTNLSVWTVIGTVTVGANGSQSFIDTNASNYPRRFYRVRPKP